MQYKVVLSFDERHGDSLQVVIFEDQVVLLIYVLLTAVYYLFSRYNQTAFLLEKHKSSLERDHRRYDYSFYRKMVNFFYLALTEFAQSIHKNHIAR